MGKFKLKPKEAVGNNLHKDNIVRLIFFLIPVIAIVLKGIIFQGFVSSENPYSFSFSTGYGMVSIVSLEYYIAFALLFVSFSLLFKGKGRIIYVFILDIIVTLLFILDVWYYRGFNTVPSVFLLTQTSNLDNLSDSIKSMMSSLDWLFIIDFVVIGAYAYKFRKFFTNEGKRCIKGFLCTFVLPFIFIAYVPFNIYVLKNPNVKNAYIIAGTDPTYTHRYLSTIGYHIHDAVTVYYNTRPYELTDEDKQDIDEYFNFKNEKLQDNEYFGAAKGKNLIYVQVESLEDFVIGQEVNGQEITPNLNKLVQKSIYFPNIFEQVNEGTSADCDFISNTSLLPVRRGATFFRYPLNDYNSMPKILEKNGYSTRVIHPDKGSFWNYELALSGGIGFNEFRDYYSFEHDEWIGMGLSDESYFKQVVPMIKEMKEPFYTMTVTLTSHAPFNIPEEYRELGLDEELNENKLGGYIESVHYTDKQIGKFLELLENEGILENSIVVFMGDHTGVHKYYNDDISKLSNQEEWFQDNGGRRVPVIIYDPSQKAAPQTIETFGGQIDMMPTVLYLLGIPSDEYNMTCMGRNLLNTEKSFAIIVNGSIKGEENLTEDEKTIVSKSLDISDKMIRANYNPYN